MTVVEFPIHFLIFVFRLPLRRFLSRVWPFKGPPGILALTPVHDPFPTPTLPYSGCVVARRANAWRRCSW